MSANETPEAERNETIEELSDLFHVVQEMGRRLAYESHGDAFQPVQALNVLLHQVREKIDEIRALRG